MQQLDTQLTKRKQENRYRSLKVYNAEMLDFASNDYLGFSKNTHLLKKYQEYVSQLTTLGSTGSRLITGNTLLHQEIEENIANYHESPSSLLFNSGYSANVGFWSTVPSRTARILYDEHIHASIREGIQLNPCTHTKFAHNSISDLENCLKNSTSPTFIAIESVYSMQGSIAPLVSILEIAQKYNAYVVVDEAHALGTISQYGLCQHENVHLHPNLLARVFTYGKALGCHGASIVSNRIVTDYLINFCRNFIYTTSLPETEIIKIKASYELLAQTSIEPLSAIITYFRTKVIELELSPYFTLTATPIQALIHTTSTWIADLEKFLLHRNIFTKAIYAPTVPINQPCIRISLHTNVSFESIDYLLFCIKEYIHSTPI